MDLLLPLQMGGTLGRQVGEPLGIFQWRSAWIRGAASFDCSLLNKGTFLFSFLQQQICPEVSFGKKELAKGGWVLPGKTGFTLRITIFFRRFCQPASFRFFQNPASPCTPSPSPSQHQ